VSLINQMLRDLDARQTGQEMPPRLDIPRSSTQGRKRKGRVTGMLMLLTGVLGLLVGAWYLKQSGVWPTGIKENEAVLSQERQAVVLEATEDAAGKLTGSPVVASGTVHPQEVVAETRLPPAETEAKPVTTEAAAVDEAPVDVVAVSEDAVSDPVEQVLMPPAEKKRVVVRVAEPAVSPEKDPTAKVGDERISRQAAAPKTSVSPAVQVKRPATKARSPEQIFNAALVSMNEGNLALAERDLDRVLELQPGHSEARKTLVLLLMRGGREQETLDLLERGLKLDSGNSSLIALKARVLVNRGSGEDALALIEGHLGAEGGDIELLSLLGTLQQQAGRFGESALTYRRILGQRPDMATAWAGLAMAQDALGRVASALEAYRRALGLHGLPERVAAYARERISMLEAGE
jgi:Flp pilus assembly protein TadD